MLCIADLLLLARLFRQISVFSRTIVLALTMTAIPQTEPDTQLTMIDTEPQKIADDLFTLRATFRMMPGVVMPICMTIIRNPLDQTLIIYSPLNPNMYADLSSLGTVTTIIAPAGMHTTYVRKSTEFYPSATLYSTPALKTRFPARDWGTIITAETASDILGTHVRSTLLTLKPEFAEIILLHESSNTLIVCDAVFNFTPAALGTSSLLFRFYTWVTGARKPLDLNTPLKKLSHSYCLTALPQYDALLEWPWSRVIPCHGDVVDQNAKELFREGMYKFVSETASKQAASAA